MNRDSQLKTITIVGLGLMGGSLAARCRQKFPSSRIIGVSRSREALKVAKKNKWIHEGTGDLKDGVRDAGFVVICTPVNTLESFLDRLERAARQGTVVTDVGSVKTPVVGWAEKRKLQNIHFVGAHPMTGSEARGIEAARPELYARSFTFVVRSKNVDAEAFRFVKSFWKKISPRVHVLSAADHDGIVGEISHMPHAVAVCLMLAVSKKSIRYAGPGFYDLTRIAAGYPPLWFSIFEKNREEIERALNRFEEKIRAFKIFLAKKGKNHFRRMLFDACERRRQILV